MCMCACAAVPIWTTKLQGVGGEGCVCVLWLQQVMALLTHVGETLMAQLQRCILLTTTQPTPALLPFKAKDHPSPVFCPHQLLPHRSCGTHLATLFQGPLTTATCSLTSATQRLQPATSRAPATPAPVQWATALLQAQQTVRCRCDKARCCLRCMLGHTSQVPTPLTVQTLLLAVPPPLYPMPGPGPQGFFQSDTHTGSTRWSMLASLINGVAHGSPNPQQQQCQGAKPVLLNVGEASRPYPWVPKIAEVALLRLGNFVSATQTPSSSCGLPVPSHLMIPCHLCSDSNITAVHLSCQIVASPVHHITVHTPLPLPLPTLAYR